MSEIVLIRYKADAKPAWDGVVKQSRNGNFLHSRDYMDYHAHRFDEQSLLIKKKGHPMAVFPCNRSGNKIVSHGGLTYGGLIYKSEIRASEILEIFNLLASHYQSLGCTSITYKAVPHIFHTYPAEEDLYALHRLGASLVRRDLSSAILINNRLKLSDLRKRMLRKSVKNGVKIIEGDFFDAYHTLLSDVLMKFKTKPVHSLDELKWLKKRFPGRIRLFGAFRENQLLAGTVVYDFGHVAHTQYLASSDAGRKTGALDHVLTHLLDNIFFDHQYFSFGVSTEKDGQYLNSGLIFQKEGFGGRGITYDHYEWEI